MILHKGSKKCNKRIPESETNLFTITLRASEGGPLETTEKISHNKSDLTRRRGHGSTLTKTFERRCSVSRLRVSSVISTKSNSGILQG